MDLVCICLSVTVRSYITPTKKKALASLQHALQQQNIAAAKMSLSYLTIHTSFYFFSLFLSLSLSFSFHILLINASLSHGSLLKKIPLELLQRDYTYFAALPFLPCLMFLQSFNLCWLQCVLLWVHACCICATAFYLQCLSRVKGK